MSFLTSRMEADPQKYPRYYANMRCRLAGPPGEIDMWCVDISATGARLALDTLSGSTFDGAGWDLLLPTVGRYPAERSWSRGSTFGVLFAISPDEEEHLAQLLKMRFPKRL